MTLIRLAIVPLVLAAFVGAYALRRRASLAGLITLAVVCFGLFALVQSLGLSVAMRWLSAFGATHDNRELIALVTYLLVTAMLIVTGAALGWAKHRELYNREDSRERV